MVAPKDVRHTVTDVFPVFYGRQGTMMAVFDDYVDRYKVGGLVGLYTSCRYLLTVHSVMS